MYTENIEEISDRLRDGYLYSSEEGIMSSTYEQIIVDILDEPDSEIIPYEQLSDESKEAFGDEEKYLEFIQKRTKKHNWNFEEGTVPFVIHQIVGGGNGKNQ